MICRMVYKSGSFYHFVTIHACDRPTDGWTDRILIARPHLHSTQCGKNAVTYSIFNV